MRIVVDFDVCASTGSCTRIAPEVFEVRSDGYLYVLIDHPTGHNEELAVQAAEMCPTAAISIEV